MRLHPRSAPGNIFILITFLIAVVSCRIQPPRIDSIDPRIGNAGQIVTIQGQHFGAERNESYVTIAGVSPTNSSYLNWNDNQIIMKMPELGDSGLLYVYVMGKKSNGMLFSNLTTLPKPAQDADTGFGPRIVSITPQTAPIGSLIIITGNNFGSSRERSSVNFNWEGEQFPMAPPEARTAESIEASDIEFGYELWSDREIRVRIPDGAVSGNIVVSTLRGQSRPFFFDVTGRPGAKTFGDKHSYTISYSVNIKVKEASGSNTLYLWMPQPAVSSSQRNIELISHNMDPFVENYKGVNLYKLNNLVSDSAIAINNSYKVDVYSVTTGIKPQSIKQDPDSAVEAAYTQPDPLIPSDNPQVKAMANTLTAGERNPYMKAQRIYEWLIKECTISPETDDAAAQADDSGNSLPAALASKQADPYTASLLFCALGRASDIPCIPLSGVLVNRNRQTQLHYWAEFWLDGMGWIPVDPAMGSGAVPKAFQYRQDAAAWYFGNMDSQRITFSRGLVSLSRMDQRGRATGRTRSYSLQNIWEEAVGGLDSYSSLWGDITVTGIY